MLGMVINLDRAQDRWSRMQQQVQAIGLSVERVSAVDAQAMAPEEIASHVPAVDDPSKVVYPRELKPGEVACFLSHRKCWQRLVDSGERWGLIFEDDVTLSPKFLAFAASENWIPEEAQLLHFGLCHESEMVDATPQCERLIEGRKYELIRQIKPFLSGAYAYLISSPAAAKALDLSKTIVAPVDDFLFSPLSPFTNGVFAYRVIPALVTTDEVTIVSTIGNRVSELSRSPWWIRHHPYRTYVKAKVWLNRLTAHREIIRAVD